MRRAAAGQLLHRLKNLHRAGDNQDADRHKRVAQRRNRHMQQPLPEICPIDSCRLHHLVRNRLEPGKIDSRNIAGLLPEIDERNTVGRERFAADPLERQLVKADGPQDIVDKARHRVEQVSPDNARNDACDDGRRKDQRLAHVHAAHRLVQEHRHKERADAKQKDGDTEDNRCVFQRDPEIRIIQQTDVVFQSVQPRLADPGVFGKAVVKRNKDRQDDVDHIHQAGRQKQ